MKKRIALIVITLFSLSHLQAQVFTRFTPTGDSLSIADTILTIQDLDQQTFQGWSLYPLSVTGNQGEPILPLHFLNYRPTFMPVMGAAHTLYPYLHHNKRPFYNVSAPVGEFKYQGGYGRGQAFKGYFTQNITPRWNFYVGFHRLNSTGVYQHQRNTFDNFQFSTNYRSENNKYQAFARFEWTQIESEQNGGVLYDTVFSDNVESNRLLIDVKLRNSDLERNESYAMLLHQYQIVGDTTGNRGLFLKHHAETKRTFHRFISEDSAYYPTTSFGGSYIDSAYRWFLKNKVMVSTSLGKKWVVDFDAGLGFLNGIYNGPLWQTSDQTLYFTGKAQFSYKAWTLFGNIEQGLVGDFSESLKYDFQGTWKKNDWRIRIGYLLQNRYADFYDRIFIGDGTNKWINDFTPFTLNQITGDLQYKDWISNLTLRTINNPIVFDQNRQPIQVSEVLDYVAFHTQYAWEIRKGLFWENKITVQASSQMEDLLRLPDYVYDTKVFAKMKLFKNSLQLMPGIEYRYLPEYKSMFVDPAGAILYLGEGENANVGNFHTLNLFLGAQISGIKLFIRYENVLQGILPYNYFYAPGYILPDRTLRIGFRWQFLN